MLLTDNHYNVIEISKLIGIVVFYIILTNNYFMHIIHKTIKSEQRKEFSGLVIMFSILLTIPLIMVRSISPSYNLEIDCFQISQTPLILSIIILLFSTNKTFSIHEHSILPAILIIEIPILLINYYNNDLLNIFEISLICLIKIIIIVIYLTRMYFNKKHPNYQNNVHFKNRFLLYRKYMLPMYFFDAEEDFFAPDDDISESISDINFLERYTLLQKITYNVFFPINVVLNNTLLLINKKTNNYTFEYRHRTIISSFILGIFYLVSAETFATKDIVIVLFTSILLSLLNYIFLIKFKSSKFSNAVNIIICYFYYYILYNSTLKILTQINIPKLFKNFIIEVILAIMPMVFSLYFAYYFLEQYFVSIFTTLNFLEIISSIFDNRNEFYLKYSSSISIFILSFTTLLTAFINIGKIYSRSSKYYLFPLAVNIALEIYLK